VVRPHGCARFGPEPVEVAVDDVDVDDVVEPVGAVVEDALVEPLELPQPAAATSTNRATTSTPGRRSRVT